MATTHLKTCTKCGQAKPHTEYHRSRNSSCGLAARCRQCARAEYKKWSDANKERKAQYDKERWSRDRERLLAGNKAYREANRARLAKRRTITNKEYYAANKDRLTESNKAWRADNQDHLRDYEKSRAAQPARAEWTKSYRAANQDQFRQYDRNKSIKRRSQKADGMTSAELRDWLRSAPHKCYWCDCRLSAKTLTVDHYVPLAKGGKHEASNLVPACRSCNSSKQAKDPLVFAREKGRLL